MCSLPLISLLNLTPFLLPPYAHTLETAFPKVTIEHYVPVSTLRACSLSHGPSSPAFNPGDHSHLPAVTPPLFFLRRALSSACVSFPRAFSSLTPTGHPQP